VKTFSVQIFVGHRVVSWPFGKLDISDEAITVRSRPAWMLKRRTASHRTINRVLIRHHWAQKVITIEDTDGVFSKINVNSQLMGYGKLQAQLEHCGYVVADRS
jgi:hypothetical protein